MRPKNTSGPMLKKIQNKLNLIYLNNDKHMHMDSANGNTDMLDTRGGGGGGGHMSKF